MVALLSVFDLLPLALARFLLLVCDAHNIMLVAVLPQRYNVIAIALQLRYSCITISLQLHYNYITIASELW